MRSTKHEIRSTKVRSGFTLVELLIVMLIIAILVLLAWGALAGVAEKAKEDRTRSIVMKLDQLVVQRYDAYRTRPLPIRIAPGTNPRAAATFRLNALRELMRMELPDRRTDIINYAVATYPMESTATGMSLAALQRTYYRKTLAATGGNLANWTDQHQGAECLYLIVSTMHDGDKNALDFFMPGEIGDIDADGMREIHDGWGNPIEFLRWAPGFRNDPGADGAWGIAATDDDSNGTLDDYSELGAAGSDDVVRLTLQRPDLPDPFDPIRLGGGFALRPLIFSAGADKSYDVNIEGNLRYILTTPPNNPYYVSAATTQAGMVLDIDGDGAEWADNITNHYTPTNAP